MTPGESKRALITQFVATSENGVIGRDGDLPWHIPHDLKRFKAMTKGHALVMGRKTWDSIGAKPLPHRLNIVVTRGDAVRGDGDRVVVCASIDAALDHALGVAASWGDEVFVVGGGDIYRAAMPRTQRIYRTVVHVRVDGDATYPEIPRHEFRRVTAEAHEAEGDVPAFTYETWERS